MATYKIIGKRYLRKYTAPEATPVYAAATDAARIVRELCNVPWEASAVRQAEMPPHGDETNTQNREKFDAALFCAGHADGMHRAYANAAVYRYAIPSAAVGKTLTGLAVRVTSDPYNAAGARVHVFTSATGEPPTNCRTVRGDGDDGKPLADGTVAAGVAPRETRAYKGKDYWYPATAEASLAPTGGLVLQKYLFLAVVLESYATTRGNWLEGASYADNLVSVTLSSDVTGWTDGGTYDLRDAETREMTVVRGGVLPSVPKGSASLARRVTVRADADLLVEADGSQTAPRDAAEGKAAAAVGRLYARVYAGEGFGEQLDAPEAQVGAYFRVSRRKERHVMAGADVPAEADVLVAESRALVIPFACPRGFAPAAVRLDFAAPGLTDGARFGVYLADGYLTAIDAQQAAAPGLYDGDSPPFARLGEITGGTSATFALPSVGRAATLVITGWLPPDAVDVLSAETQGTGAAPFLPDVTLCE